MGAVENPHNEIPTLTGQDQTKMHQRTCTPTSKTAISTFDTSALAALVYGQTVLKKACDTAEIEFSTKEAHNAEYDTRKTAELFCRMINRWKTLGGWPLPERSESGDDTATGD